MTSAPVVEPSDAERVRGRDPPSERAIMRQVWRHLGFLHWPVDRQAVARLLPPGLQVDTHAGVAYVGIVPFTIPSSRASGIALPLAPAFHEINLRTYVHRGGHDPGVWFFSLDAGSLLAVLGARVAYGLPYFHARMSMDVAGERDPKLTYRSRRKGREAQAEFHGSYWPTGGVRRAEPGTLEFFLIERYLLYAGSGTGLKTARVHHVPYPIQSAAATIARQTLMSAAALPNVEDLPPIVHYARQVEVQIYRPHLCLPA